MQKPANGVEMHITKLHIKNFRNFSNLKVSLAGNVIVVGENRVGKSNLIHALRLILDPTLPDSSRQLMFSDFWDGLGEPSRDDRIFISIEIKEFEEDLDVLAILSDFRLNSDHETVRLNYCFSIRPDFDGDKPCLDDFDFICFGGEDESKQFGHDLRRRITLDVLPALRDTESELSTWRRSPLRPLIENAFRDVELEELEKIQIAISQATDALISNDEVLHLEDGIKEAFALMAGERQDIDLKLGLSPTDPKRLYRSIKLMIDNGMRSINDASLGSTNMIYLSLKLLEMDKLIEENKREHTILAVEEPEAHLHPHLQRSVYKHLFEEVAEKRNKNLSTFLTTHSPHIASVAPVKSILLLKEKDGNTNGYSTACIDLSESEIDDISRYLDVTRAEILFSRGVILVEGDAERFLLPEFSKQMKVNLDHLGISICSVSGTNFTPYVKLLSELEIPFSVVTDCDPKDDGNWLGYNRSLKIIQTINPDESSTPTNTTFDAYLGYCAKFGVFINTFTLEVDLFKEGYASLMINKLQECGFGVKRNNWLAEWSTDNTTVDFKKLLAMIDDVGKGRFAQILASNLSHLSPPNYIKQAIEFVVSRV